MNAKPKEEFVSDNNDNDYELFNPYIVERFLVRKLKSLELAVIVSEMASIHRFDIGKDRPVNMPSKINLKETLEKIFICNERKQKAIVKKLRRLNIFKYIDDENMEEVFFLPKQFTFCVKPI